LQAEGWLQLVGAVCTLHPATNRARLLRGTFDALGLGHVPVGIGSDGGCLWHEDTFTESALEYMPAAADGTRFPPPAPPQPAA
jgi:hypothetical protein